MKLTKKSEYALLALIELANHYPNAATKIKDICQAKQIPQKYLEQILILLKHAGYVKSERGNHGGYELAKDPSTINLAEIIRLIDGALAPVSSVSTFFYNSSPIEQSPKLITLFKDIRDYISLRLETTTLADIIDTQRII